MKIGFANVQIIFQTGEKEFIFSALYPYSQQFTRKKLSSERIFYEQFKKIVYFCKLNFEDFATLAKQINGKKKEQKNIAKNEKNIPTVTEKKSKQARFPQENVYRQW